MKAKTMLALAIGASAIILGRGAYAQVGGTLSHISLSAVGQNLDYEETASGSTLDSDKGMMWGAQAQWRQDINEFLVIGNVSYTATNSATYDGSLQDSSGNTTPYSFDSEKEKMFLLQADVGYKVVDSGRMTLAPLLGLGYRDWVRGQDDIANGDYKEDYHWFFVDGGVDFDLKAGNWLFGFLGKLAYPLSPKMETDVAGDSLTTLSFDIGAVLSYIATATVKYRFPSSDPSKRFYIALTPFYEHWGIGASPTIYYVSQNYYPGHYVGMYEPDSSTSIYGLTLGFGLDASLF
jgi:hypothetical protein